MVVAALSESVKAACLVAAGIIALSVRPLGSRSRRSAGFQLPPRGPRASTPTTMVGLYIPPFGGGSASLAIGPGRVEVYTFLTSRPIAAQKDGPITIVRPRFPGLSWRRGFIIRGDTWWLGLRAYGATARRITGQLREAGFEIEERRSRWALFPLTAAAGLANRPQGPVAA
jgi:hypothetical protein